MSIVQQICASPGRVQGLVRQSWTRKTVYALNTGEKVVEGCNQEMSCLKNVLITGSCKGAGKFYCGTCTQCRWNTCNCEIKIVVGSLLRKAAELTAPSVLKPQAACLLPHYWAKSWGISLAVNAHNIARRGDIAGFCALAHFLLLTTLSKVNWTKKTCCFPCHFFFLFLPGWTPDALKALNTMISRSIPRNNLSCPVTHPFPREAAASDAAGEQGLPGTSSGTNQSDAKRDGKQLRNSLRRWVEGMCQPQN